MRTRVAALLLAAAGAVCTRLPPPAPLAEPQALAGQLQSAATPDRPQFIAFRWRYRGREGYFSGEGSVRVNPPDSVRLDLLGPGWSGVQSAVLLGDRVHYIGEQRIRLPPPTFMWSMLGVFRPPEEIAPVGTRRGDTTRLSYRLTEKQRVAFEFDASDRLVKAELLSGQDVLQRIELRPSPAADEAGGWTRPEWARFRDLKEFNEVSIEVTEAREHEAFEARIFRVAAR